MGRETRDRFLDTAETRFAESGFYGASIAAIAGDLGLTKQALLHHFGSKEKLYGYVLQRISDRFEAMANVAEELADNPVLRLKAYFQQLYQASSAQPAQTRLLMRELLDNKHRAATAETWYLKPFLTGLIAMVQAMPGWQDVSEAKAFAMVYQCLGAINYYSISKPTLIGIFGPQAYAALDTAFPEELDRMFDNLFTHHV